jgi:HlyD family secretion protein
VIDYDTARNNEVAAVQDAEAQRDLAQATLDALLQGKTSFEIAEKERAVRRAELALAQAKQEAAADPDLVKGVEANRLQIEEIESQIAERRLYAPFDGDIAVVSATPALPIQVGTSVMTLVDDSRLEITATDDGTRTTQPRVNPGQPVQLTFSRYNSETFSGSITYAPNLADVNNTDTSYHITFDAKGRALSVGDVAEVQVTLGRKYEALWLPIDAVHFTRDRPYVFVDKGGESKRTEVVTGIITSERVEIISGLKEGEVVVIQ